jgi:hypothetical protein
MSRRKFLKVPKTAIITCLSCGRKSKRRVPLDSSPMYFDCDKCNKRMNVPVTQCCIICAYTNKRCVPSLKIMAMKKGLELKY